MVSYERYIGKYVTGSDRHTIPEEIRLDVLGKTRKLFSIIGISTLILTKHLTKMNSFVNCFQNLFVDYFWALGRLR